MIGPIYAPQIHPPGGSHVKGLLFLSRHAQRTFTWACPACHRTIIDNGPWTDVPGREAGHEPDCPRRAAEIPGREERPRERSR